MNKDTLIFLLIFINSIPIVCACAVEMHIDEEKKNASADARRPIFQTPMVRNVDFWVGVGCMGVGPVGRGNVP